MLVTADGTPKLLDFGISKLIEGDAPTADETALTRLAGRPLTLAYAAPEQVLGQPVTVAADVYALGVMLFELASGARLYRATTPRALEDEVLRGDLRRPSESAPDQARAKALRGDLDAIVADRAEARARAALPQRGRAGRRHRELPRRRAGARAARQPCLPAAQVHQTQPRCRWPPAAPWCWRWRPAWASALWQAGQARLQAEEARNQAERATALNTFVLSLIQQSDPRASQSSKAADLAMLSSIEKRIDTEFKGSPDQLVQLRVTVGDAYRERGQPAAARRVYRRAIAEAETTLPANHLGLLKARVARASFVVADDEALQSHRHHDRNVAPEPGRRESSH